MIAGQKGSGDRRRRLPPVHALLADARLESWQERLGRDVVRRGVAAVLAVARTQAEAGDVPDAAAILDRVERRLRGESRPRLRAVINATGIVLHTGLGRAPLAAEAVEAVARVAAGYSNLEFDLQDGERGDRHALVASALGELTGAPAAMVVNNNAAAVLLLLAALAAGREVVVSRGELVEIGGSFRIPEVLAQSGASLVEVGTTNRTYARDYTAATKRPGATVALLLKVHQSNFRQVGFTAAPGIAELAAVARGGGIPLAYDMGSGTLWPGLGPQGAVGEPTVREALAAGADVVTWSGDKLLGGPQAGVLCGRADLIRHCARHPLARAVRVDKLTLAALEATLALYREGRAAQAVPALRMLRRPPGELAREAEALAAACGRRLGPRVEVTVVAGASAAGAGALAAVELPTALVRLRARGAAVSEWAAALRTGEVPLVARVQDDALLLDPRTLLPGQSEGVPDLLAAALTALAAG